MANRRVELLRRQLQEAEEEAAREQEHKFSNHGTSNSFNNHGTSNSFNNQGGGGQNFSGARINSGANYGDRNRYRTAYNYGGRTINNSGTFSGHGNAGFIDGDFHGPTTNYNY